MADRVSDVERMLVEHLPLVEEIVAIVCRQRRFSGDESEEFGSLVRLRLVDDNYRILRRFRGESSLRTYLITVVQRLALDFVIARTGKWRPSATARRLGPRAMRLEELLVRDRRSPEEACETLRRTDPGCTREELLDLARQLPLRARRRRVPSDAAELERLADPQTPLTAIETTRDGAREAAAVGVALRGALATLAAEDRLLLKLRFESGLAVPQIARSLGRPAKRLYKRTDWLLQKLRLALAGAGITGLDDPGFTGRLVEVWSAAGENDVPRPSTGVGRAARDEGRSAPAPAPEDDR